MAEPLKNSFGPDIPVIIADAIGSVWSGFDRSRFLERALAGYDELELTPRARQISDAMAACLPTDRSQALSILIESLGPENQTDELTGMEPFRYMPHVYFVADHGTEHFDQAMNAQYELTKRFTAEFSIRTYLERFPERTLARLEQWATDESVHVRRLVSEGTRPRLPWAQRLRDFQADPGPVIKLLEKLKDDPEEYVRRSVANNLNDISKDHPELVVELVERWWLDADERRRRLIRHGLRTLIKSGDPGALAVLGFGSDSPARVETVMVEPDSLAIGESVRITVELANPSDEQAAALVDLVVHFVKANGSTSPKVFKGGERLLAPHSTAMVAKTISLTQRSTRTHYPGQHTIEIQINGVAHKGGSFQLRQS